jgi:hypothetical protein
MKTYQIDILNPKALKLLQDLADLKLIALRKTEDSFQDVIVKLRNQASSNPPSLDEIIQEVEIVRAKRYGSKKG